MSKKFVVVLNKSYEANALLSALGHVSAGLMNRVAASGEANFVDYVDADGKIYPSVSESPFIVLRGQGSKIKALSSELGYLDVKWTCYLDTMISGGSPAQVAATLEKKTDDLIVMAIAMFGEAAKIDPLTKKFSVWR